MVNRAVVVPTFDQLMNPTLAALHALGGSGSIPELVERVITDLRLPREVVEQPHGDRGFTELEYRLAWARTYLKKYGLIENSSRAVWSLTPRGLETKAIEPQDVVKAVRAMFVADRKAKVAALEETEEIGADEDNEGKAASWRERLLKRLLAMPPASFERLCMRVLRESGFIQVEVTGRSAMAGSTDTVSSDSSGCSRFGLAFSASATRIT